MSKLDAAADQLRARYVEGLPAKRAVLSEALDALRRHVSLDADKTLRRLAHQIRGAAASFRFTGIDKAASWVEHADDAYDLELMTQALIDEIDRVYASEPRTLAQVLVIDDDPFIGMFMAEILRDAGVALEQVTSAAAALPRLTQRWDLVVVDLVLPDADGRTLLADIRELPQHRHTPLLVLSAKTGSLVKNECYMAGIDGFVNKPIDEATFPTLVAAVIERARGRELAEPATLPPAASDRREPGQRPRILIAEDDDDLAHLLERDLADDFEPERVATGEQAMAAARRTAFDLVLLDYHMPPGRNGVEVLRDLRMLEPYYDAPILLLTALGSDEAIEAAFEAGASDYVTKPYTRRALLARLYRHLARPSRA